MPIIVPDPLPLRTVPQGTHVILYGDWLRSIPGSPPKPIHRLSVAEHTGDMSLVHMLQALSDILDAHAITPVEVIFESVVETEEGLHVTYHGMPFKYQPTPTNAEGNIMSVILALIREYVIKALSTLVVADVLASGLTPADEAIIDGIVADAANE